MMEDIRDYLPCDANEMLGFLFIKGNIVKNFKLVGHSNGYTVVFQLGLPSENNMFQGESPICTPKSKLKYKSPSTQKRDHQRLNSYLQKEMDIDNKQSNISLSNEDSKEDNGCDNLSNDIDTDGHHSDESHSETMSREGYQSDVSELENDLDDKQQDTAMDGENTKIDLKYHR